MRARYLTEDEIAALAGVNPAAWLPFVVGAKTGLRIGDVLTIRPVDIYANGIRYVAQKTGKGGKAPLDVDTICDLLANAKRSQWCFPSPRDPRKHLTRQAAWARVKRACKRAGVDPRGVSPHSFRKVFAVGLLHKTNLAEVQKALQHDRVDTTELYALADWATGENAKLPLTRGDLPLLVGQILSTLGYGVDGRPKA